MSRRARWYWTVRAAVGWIVVGLVATVVLSAADSDAVVDRASWSRSPRWRSAHLVVMPQWRYRVHRWEITDTAVYTQSGWLHQERRIAPIARVQTVDTERGPFEQLFGLANVTVTTASAKGPIKIHALDRAVAEHTVDWLTERAQASRRRRHVTGVERSPTTSRTPPGTGSARGCCSSIRSSRSAGAAGAGRDLPGRLGPRQPATGA